MAWSDTVLIFNAEADNGYIRVSRSLDRLIRRCAILARRRSVLRLVASHLAFGDSLIHQSEAADLAIRYSAAAMVAVLALLVGLSSNSVFSTTSESMLAEVSLKICNITLNNNV